MRHALPARRGPRPRCIRWSAGGVTILLSTTTACGAPAPDERPGDEVRPAPEPLNRVTNAYPAWSPDGRSIAYMSTADGDFDAYIVNPEAGERCQLTDTGARDGTPVWSPDGRYVAYARYRWFPGQPFYEASEIMVVAVP